MIFVNFKTYQQATGEMAVKLAEICREVAEEASLEVIPFVQSADLFRLASQNFEVWAQHVDDIEFGPSSGRILPEAVLAAGAKGTLLNHSERKLPLEVIKASVVRCRRLGLKAMVCADSVEEAKEIEKSAPDFLAYEPPEFIGSQTDSVATARPEVIKAFVSKIKSIPVLVGAGIHSQEDVKIALKLGAQGILVSSDVVLAKDPKNELLDLAKGFR
jgi:triosephosphate isomerase